MPIRHAEWLVRSNQVIKFSSYTRAEREMSLSFEPEMRRLAPLMGCSNSRFIQLTFEARLIAHSEADPHMIAYMNRGAGSHDQRIKWATAVF
jgi:hypothetical protein